MEPFKWTGRSQEAALLVAEDRLTNQEIAEKVGIKYQTLRRWKLHPEFRARVDSLLDSMARAALEHGIANREVRIRAMVDRWRRLKLIVEARAREMAGVSGGSSGLLMKEMKVVKVEITLDDVLRDSVPMTARAQRTLQRAAARRTVEVPHYSLDSALLRELRELERQIAIEMGHWRHHEPTVNMLMVTATPARQLEPGSGARQLEPGGVMELETPPDPSRGAE